MGNEKLLTVKQAASRLGIHYQTLRAWADTGKVPVVRLKSGYRRFEPAVIERVRRDMGFERGDEEGNGPTPPTTVATVSILAPIGTP